MLWRSGSEDALKLRRYKDVVVDHKIDLLLRSHDGLVVFIQELAEGRETAAYIGNAGVLGALRQHNTPRTMCLGPGALEWNGME